MKLNKNGAIARFYAWAHGNHEDYTGYDAYYNRPLPKSLCPFFWALIVALLFFPFIAVTLLIERLPFLQNVEGSDRLTLLNRLYLSLAVYFILGLLVGLAYLSYAHTSVLLSILGVVILVGIVSLAVYYFFAASYTWESIVSHTQEVGREMKTIVFAKKESFFEKYCPKIDWE